MATIKEAKRDELNAVEKRMEVPDFVKNASADGWDQLSPAGYASADADYPIHSKAATWLSITRFLQKEGSYKSEKRDRLEYFLKNAAKEWDVDYDKIKKAMHPAPDPPDRFALTKEAQGQVHQLMPLTDENSVDEAADYLFTYRSRLPYTWRKEAARNILVAAQEKDVTPRREEYLLKAAGLGVSTRTEVVGAILQRAARVKDTEVANKLKKYASEWYEKTEVDFDELNKCAELLGQIDERAGLTEYDDTFPTPEECLFRQTARKAAQCKEDYVELSNGRVVHKSQIEGKPYTKMADAVGGALRNAMENVIIPDWSDFRKAAEKLGPGEADTLCLFLGDAKDEGGWKPFA